MRLPFPRVRWRAALGAALAAALTIACRRAAPPPAPEAAKPSLGVPHLLRSVRVEPDRVVVEGTWFPIEAGPESPAIPNAVRFVCERALNSCREELTRLAGESGTEPVHEVFEYQVTHWTAWQQRAGKLVAQREDGTSRTWIRVYLRGGTALKVVIQEGRATRWRIE